jgi:hypothetical protein
MDGLHHQCQHRIEKLACFLGISVGEQLHRPLEVGEENGDLLALAFESRLGGENLLGEMLRGVGLGRGELRRGLSLRRRGDWLATFLAELRAESIGRSTTTARHFQPRPAVLAKHRINGALALTSGALHWSLTIAPLKRVGTVEGD